MIAFIKGKIEFVENTPSKVIVETKEGIGYEVNISKRTEIKLRELGENKEAEIKLLTQVVKKEDSETMYGFAEKNEKETFLLLTELVDGVGPKSSLNILSELTQEELTTAIIENKPEILLKAKGIGNKSAQKIILELKGKIFETTLQKEHPSNISNAILGLVSLGFKQKEAKEVINEITAKLGAKVESEVLIKEGLKRLK